MTGPKTQSIPFDAPILVLYVGIKDQPLDVSKKIMTTMVKNISNEIDYAHSLVIASQELPAGEIRVECVNPKLLSEDEMTGAKAILERATVATEAFIKEATQ